VTKYCAVIGTHSTVQNRVWPRKTSAQRVVVDVNDDPTQGQMVEIEAGKMHRYVCTCMCRHTNTHIHGHVCTHPQIGP